MTGSSPARHRLLVPAGVAALALASSITSLGNRFAYDDRPIVEMNASVHSLVQWWHFFGESYWPPSTTSALYRPLAILLFAVQWAIGHGSPVVFHVVNVALYVALCLAVLRLARLALPEVAAAIAAALFAVHPVHVEAVGNVVGQGELWTALALCLATSAYVVWRRQRSLTAPRSAVLLGVFFLAMFVKENAVVLPALLLAAEMLLIGDALSWRQRLSGIRPLLLGMTALFMAYLVARLGVLPEGLATDVPHPVWMALDLSHRLATVLAIIVPEWVRLLVWPARLLADYSPRDLPEAGTWSTAALPGLAVVTGTLAIAVVGWRRAPAASFGILFFVIALSPVSNVLVPTGVMLAERTLLVPSAGFLIAVASLVPWMLGVAERAGRARQVQRAGGVALGLLLVAGAVQSANRQRTWRSSADVFIDMMADAPLNFRSHWGWGTVLMDRHLFAAGEREWRIAIDLYPAHLGPAAELGNAYRTNGLCGAAVPLYRQVLDIAPDRADIRADYVTCLLKTGQVEMARDESARGIARGGSTPAFRVLLAASFRRLVKERSAALKAGG